MIADIGTIHARDGFRLWNQYFYGRVTQLVPGSPFPGYVAPPLDGIWATAPFLHNGSVPNLELLLNSRARPGVVNGLGVWWRKLGRNGTNVNELTHQRLTDLGAAPAFYDCLVEVAAL